MASNELEVLESTVATENVESSDAGVALTRRQLWSAFAVAGAAAGIALVSAPSAAAQQPIPHGYNQLDVMNFLLNIKYLTATLYSFATQGADLPPSSFASVGTGGVFNAPGKVTFSSQQITDLFNELYYDELNHVIDLRNLLGSAVVGRQTINLLGNGATTNTKTSYTQSEVIALARMLEDVTVTAFTGATIYLSGSNLDYAARIVSADGFHAGALRLLSIQTGAQYQSPAYAFGAATTSGATAINFSGTTVSGNKSIPSFLNALTPSVGNLLTGVGIPQGAASVVTGVTSKASVTPTGILVKGSNVINTVSSFTGVANNQPITGTNIAAGAYIQSFDATAKTITMSAQATNSSTVAPTGFVTSGSNVVKGVSSVSGIANGQPITGTGIPANTTVTATDSKALTITMSAQATVTPTVTPTGVVTAGSSQVTALSNTSGLIAGQPISGTGIPSDTYIASITGNTLSLSDVTLKNAVNATATSPITASYTFTGIVTAASNIITPTGAFSGIVAGQSITGAGIPSGTTITSFNSTTVTISANATASSVANPTGMTYIGSAVITNVSSIAGLVVGQPISGTGVAANATISALSSSSANPLTITMSSPATAISATPVKLSSPSAITLTTKTSATTLTANTSSAVTIPTAVTLTIGQSIVTIADNATATGVQTISVVVPDPLDVEPADPGDATTSAKGPQVIAGTTLYQGFFNTAGSGSGNANAPAGFAFTRTFSQVLAVLINTNSTNTMVATQNYQGGFFPVGVAGTITSVA